MSDKFVFYPEGVCSMMIEIELDGDIIRTLFLQEAATATSAAYLNSSKA